MKSLRSGRISLDEAYGRVDKGEVWLVGCDIPEYEKANQLNHVPKRRRKLLLHRREIAKFAGHAFDKGLTLVPLKMYFSLTDGPNCSSVWGEAARRMTSGRSSRPTPRSGISTPP